VTICWLSSVVYTGSKNWSDFFCSATNGDRTATKLSRTDSRSRTNFLFA
jgi:hypothetical protein